MDLQRSIVDQSGVQNTLANIGQNVRNTLNEFGEDAGKAVASIAAPLTGAPDSTSVSTSSVTEEIGNFLDLNGLMAKIAFLFLVLFSFVALLRLSISLVGYYMQPKANPYVVKGLLSGGSAVDISQDPAKPSAVPIPRSNDVGKGAEFTWSVWLFIDQQLPSTSTSTSSASATVKWSPIFVKGEGVYDPASGINACNGPGMYVSTSDKGVTTVRVAMDTVGHSAPDIIDIPNIPQKKWVHVAIRLQNTVVDLYVNGVIATRTVLSSAPKQNYYDVHVCPNGGFAGSLSDLRYFSSALTVFGVNNVVTFGPNTTSSALTTDVKAVGGNHSYLSNAWYK